MALTLLDMQRKKKDDYDKEVINVWAQASDPSRILPIETINTLEVTENITNSIPTVGFRKLGEAFGAVKGGAQTPRTEAVFSMGGTIDIDKQNMRDKKFVVDPLTRRTKEAVTGFAWKFNEAFIRGDHATDEDSFEGLIVRLALAGSTQTVYGGNTDTSASYLEAKPGTATTADAQALLDKIDEARYAVDGNKAEVCFTTAKAIRGIKSALRRLGLYKDTSPTEPSTNSGARRTSAEPFNKPLWEYDGTRFYDMGLMAANQSTNPTQIIADETVATKSCTPLYFMKLGHPYLHIIQQYDLEVSKPFLADDGVTWRQVVDWPCGLANFHPKTFSKLAGVKFGA